MSVSLLLYAESSLERGERGESLRCGNVSSALLSSIIMCTIVVVLGLENDSVRIVSVGGGFEGVGFSLSRLINIRLSRGWFSLLFSTDLSVRSRQWVF